MKPPHLPPAPAGRLQAAQPGRPAAGARGALSLVPAPAEAVTPPPWPDHGLDTELKRRAAARIDTPHLQLELIRVDHAPMLREAVLTSRADLGFIDWAQGPWDLDQARAFCRKSAAAVARGGYLSYIAFERLPRSLLGARMLRGRYVGLLDLHSFDWRLPRCQIGYVGDSALRGQGLMREAALGLMRAAHGWGLHRIEAWCDARNRRSQHFAESLGLCFEGRLRQQARDLAGQPCDQLVYARLAGDPWPVD